MKRTSKIKAMASLLSAVVMLSTTVFANDSLADFATDDYTIDILNNSEKIEFANKPFIENGDIYVPLRETLYNIGVMDNSESYIKWDNGKITISINDPKKSVNGYSEFAYQIEIGQETQKTLSNPEPVNFSTRITVPILKNDNTYIQLDFITNILTEIYGTHSYRLKWHIYDKDNVLVALSLYPINDKTALTTIPNYEDKQQICNNITERFFESFSKGDMENMKQYCTNEFANDYFHNDSFLSMTSGTLKTIYSIRAFSNGDYYVHLKMSSNDLTDKEKIYYAIYEEQPDGEFLLKAFQESHYDEWEATR